MFDKLRREWHLRDIDNRIRRHGWMAMFVGDHRASPCWAYSIGFEESLGQPEVVIFDIPKADADDEGRYPWDAGCKVRESQPLLFQPFDPEQLKRGPLAALMRM